MGVSGLWDILSPAEKKYSLEELALDRITRHNKQLRIAIDYSIWKIQAQSTLGGKNAGLRTLFYRCCRLHALGIRPVFVFDGEQRPAYKRNKVINTSLCDTVEHHLFMAMLKLFRFATWQATGEAEAECAVLQRLGYVDLVFTTDVDVFLFGGQRVARSWPGTDYEPIACIDIDWIQQMTSLDRSDMIFMALLSGSDYGSGINQIGIQVSHALAKLKSHRPILDTYQATLENNNNVNLKPLLHDLMEDLQHELNTNQSGHLRRRQHKLDLKTLIDYDQFTRLAMDWIRPNTAIMDTSNMEAARMMDRLLNDLDVTPEYTSLACFCQTQFDWSKAITIDKFARKLYPGYMLQRIISQARATSLSTTKTANISTHRKRHHPYFDKHYRNRDLFYTNDIRPDDLQHIHMMKDVRKNKQDIRLQKLSRCRVEWQPHTLETFLSTVKMELLDDVGTDDDCCTQAVMDSQASDFDSQVMDKANDQEHNDDDDDDDDCIDITTTCYSSASPPLASKPPPPLINSAPPPLAFKEPPPLIESTPSTTTKGFWMNEYCDVKKCCRQWVGSNLIQKVYPKMMDAFTTATKKKARSTKATLDGNQKSLDVFFTRTNTTSSINLSSTLDTRAEYHQPPTKQQQLGPQLILPSRRR
ncbi:PIN domain-like protein [Chlamydoabsidia padenii]|nr:PIN domain-like protein [Chlamydoabsidia padenii]